MNVGTLEQKREGLINVGTFRGRDVDVEQKTPNVYGSKEGKRAR